MGLSIRAYARHRGVTESAVRKAIATGRITPQVDGLIDADSADAQWARNTAPPRRGAGARTAASTASQHMDAQSLPAGGGTSLLQARTVNEVLKAKIRQVDLAERKEALIDRAKTLAQVFKLARTERDAWLNWPARITPRMAADLAVDEHSLHQALDAAVREHLQELGDLKVDL